MAAVKAMRIGAEALLDMFTKGNKIHVECIEGAPADARITSVYANHSMRVFTLFVESNEWDFGVGNPEVRVVFKDISEQVE